VIVFADTSALGSAYLDDEEDGPWIRRILFAGADEVVVSELADVEFASLLDRARRAGRIDEDGVAERLSAYAGHSADGGPIGVLPLTRDTVATARRFVLEASVRTLDALHLASADVLFEASSDQVSILTRDVRQAAAARALGFTLYPDPSG